MSFADELRSYNSDDEKNRLMNVQIKKDVSVFVSVLKDACISAIKQNKRDVSIYCAVENDEYGPQYHAISILPTVQEHTERAQTFNKERYDSLGSRRSVGSGIFETQLYGNIYIFSEDKLEYVRKLKNQLETEIKGMGFTSYIVSLIMLDNVIIQRNRKAGLFSGTVRESISTKISGKIYTIRIQAAW